MSSDANRAAPPAKSFSQGVLDRLSAAEVAALNKIRWHDRLTSLWAPVSVLALVFLVYLAIVESAACAYLWLQPPMQGLAALAFGWWVVLVVMRFAARGWNARRLARHRAEEVLTEVETMATKARASLKEKTWGELVEKAAVLVQKLPGGADDLNGVTKELSALDEKHLSAFRGSSALDLGSGFVKALAVALLVRTVFIEPFKIPSGSMIPTLEIGDQIFVNKFIYGVRIPFTNYVPFQIVRAPARGDIVVFNNPLQPNLDFIKRVIGVGGDEIELRGRSVIVNGVELPTRDGAADLTHYEQDNSANDSWLPNFSNWAVNDWREMHPSLHYETIGGKDHYILYEDRAPNFADGRFTVPDGTVFVMGDNRDHSSDGRFGLGTSIGPRFVFVPLGHIKGKATVIWLPLGHGGWFSSFFGGTGFRADRLFLPLTLCRDEPPRVK